MREISHLRTSWKPRSLGRLRWAGQTTLTPLRSGLDSASQALLRVLLVSSASGGLTSNRKYVMSISSLDELGINQCAIHSGQGREGYKTKAGNSSEESS